MHTLKTVVQANPEIRQAQHYAKKNMKNSDAKHIRDIRRALLSPIKPYCSVKSLPWHLVDWIIQVILSVTELFETTFWAFLSTDIKIPWDLSV